MGTITLLLAQWSEGDQDAFQQLVGIAYDDLRAIAHRRLIAGGSDDLATTALVHEAYLRLVGRVEGAWESRAHFYAFASRAMRHILVDHARRRQADRRGGGAVQIPLEDWMMVESNEFSSDCDDVIGVDTALLRLAERHPRMAQVVELRFFGGFTMPEIAEVLETSVRTVEREWTRARAYLLESLSRQDTREP